MRKQFLRWLINIVGFYIAATYIPGISLKSFEAGLFAGVILGLVNLLLRPILLLLTLPINILTLGIFTLIVNTWMILITDFLLPGLKVDGFGNAFLTVLIITGLNLLINPLCDD
ncbi:MAG TPA: phage holin family protein [Bacillota bacterium]|nr:phage holin family protein [Bacillota bacterium]HPO98427.1 phage holin family protein [Bacillota bacterium]